MLKVKVEKWGQSAEHLRHLATMKKAQRRYFIGTQAATPPLPEHVQQALATVINDSLEIAATPPQQRQAAAVLPR